MDPFVGVAGKVAPFLMVRSSPAPPRGPMICHSPDRGAACPGLNLVFFDVFTVLEPQNESWCRVPRDGNQCRLNDGKPLLRRPQLTQGRLRKTAVRGSKPGRSFSYSDLQEGSTALRGAPTEIGCSSSLPSLSECETFQGPAAFRNGTLDSFRPSASVSNRWIMAGFCGTF